MKFLVVQIVRFYQLALSPFLGHHCRFAPTCSRYTLDAVEKLGTARGIFQSAMRILRCHPFSAGGYDPA